MKTKVDGETLHCFFVFLVVAKLISVLDTRVMSYAFRLALVKCDTIGSLSLTSDNLHMSAPVYLCTSQS